MVPEIWWLNGSKLPEKWDPFLTSSSPFSYKGHFKSTAGILGGGIGPLKRP